MGRINSCAKGKQAERDAAKFLRSLGFADAKRTQQHCGDAGNSDVECPHSLPDIFIEVKSDRRAILGGAFLDRTLQKAMGQAVFERKYPVVIWRQFGGTFRLYCNYYGALATFTGDTIRVVLERLQLHQQERA